MASSNGIRILSFIIYAYFFDGGASYGSVYVQNGDDFDYKEYYSPKNYINDPKSNYPCGKNLRITNLTQPFIVGEGLFWSTKSSSLYFVDGAKSTICRYSVHTKELFCAKLGNESVQFIIPLLNMPHKYLASYGGNLIIVTWDARRGGATFEILKRPDPDPTHFVNDAKADFFGNLFFITEPIVPPTGLDSVPANQSQLYNIRNGEQKAVLTKLSFGNGIGFSYDETFIYISDSHTNRTYECDYDRATNSIKRTRVLIDYVKRGIPCFPDSMTVDTKGYIWTTCNRDYRVLKVEPHTGNIVYTVKLPARAPTNVAFGECPGKRNNILNCLYVISERIRLSSPTPYDGALFVIENTGSEGYPPNEVNLNELTNKEAHCHRSDKRCR